MLAPYAGKDLTEYGITRITGGAMRTSNAVKRLQGHCDRLENLLARAYYALNDAHVMAYNPTLLIDIREALERKRGRTGPKTVGRGNYRGVEK